MWRVQLYIFLHRQAKMANWAREFYLSRKLMPYLFNFKRNFSDRRYMTEAILPALASSQVQRVLFVGCKEYTALYGKRLIRAAIDYWTTDIEPTAAIWGQKDHHIISDITKIDEVCPAESFDAVLLNGVFGNGVNKVGEMNQAVKAIARILRPNGVLLIGWNSQKKHPDPIELDAVTTYFHRDQVLSLPLRKTFSDTDHVYDWLVKTNDAGFTAS